MRWREFGGFLLLLLCSLAVSATALAGTVVRFDTVEGSFDVELFDDTMPRTVANFLAYVNAERYDGSVVHRNSDTIDGNDFVIQGGGYFLYDPAPPETVILYEEVETETPIADEPGGGVAGPSNVRGTIAMAKLGLDTVTSEWFINQGDNSFLDDPQRPDGGFAAFGQVLGDGMEVVDAIGDLPLPPDFGFGIGSPGSRFYDLPLRNFEGTSIADVRVAHTVTVNSVTVVPEPENSLLVFASLGSLLALRRGSSTARASNRPR